MNAFELERAELRRQIDGWLAKEKLTASERKQCDLAMSKLAGMKSDDERRSKIAQVGSELGLNFNVSAPTEKDTELAAFRAYMAQGTVRSYAPMSDAVQGAYVVPATFFSQLALHAA